jgi:hypothetical protein
MRSEREEFVVFSGSVANRGRTRVSASTFPASVTGGEGLVY